MAPVCRHWRLWILPVSAGLYAVSIVSLVPILLATSTWASSKKKNQAALIGGAFVLLTLPIALYEIVQHMIHYTHPGLQKHVIRILWMVPIYAGNAWLGLMLSKGGIYVDNLREYYEAYVIYNFMMYLLAYVNARPEERPDERSYEERAIDERTHEEILDQERPDEEGLDEEKSDNERPNEQKPNERSKSLQMHHSFPFCCLHDWEMGREFVHKCKHGILQYTAVRSLTSLISFICDLNGVYGEGEFRTDVAFPYLVAVNNLSQFVAMYCLVLFYRANAETLKPIKPIRKFFCIKAVIFFSFLAMWDVSDVHNDIKEHFDVLRSSLGRRVRGRSASAQGWRMVTERTSLLPETSGTTGGDEPSCSFSNTGETEEDELGVFHSLPYVDNTKNTVSV
ncbi:transmembrane protein 184C isoform X2 [Frieseomelitta varia]|uniref:transmembrane protein 184C isoform X2 n=1 Tax=Frieseomelitta varia TaxID=561572 RepID=UPI001CB68E22|nr:transmembrane protein 184C isoform X2 [Frieseomelitta varia]